ncbi:Predicted membrane protein [Tenacibaculum sp. MAR_2009_124]|uniref:DUF2306 domain-containing protein n=1 Tax=Tenacibaculum sp. MAR_2009_124 TaxID=1250059 RepID=UPI00089A647C|nr:DUF2306 domain-containing protein [Tenacibaculum sp. MAR_2009_124]SEC28595.1 Predicted membrane protein [Tenacibaculum sp. MAR_2009_124]
MLKASKITIAILSTLIGMYPIIYFVIDRKFGLLSSKSAELLNDILWNTMFYGHITLGGLSLLIGWIQFSKRLRDRRINIHRLIGKTYTVSVLISGICGLYIALNATGGIISIIGFFSLGIVWLYTTIIGYKTVIQGNIRFHEKMMIYSYAACFAAVTLRIWLPILTSILGEFLSAYRIVAWLCWVPNLIVAYFIINTKKYSKKELTVIHNSLNK